MNQDEPDDAETNAPLSLEELEAEITRSEGLVQDLSQRLRQTTDEPS
ncbi:hypothetical protein [Nesterenkonia lutea]|uniref:Nucleotide exchange factor GrpE n=1 Tax=Nesterenkonia lutea TaxID=272919 RepID=A0ABR9JCB5_9MICC|nr:hypothetical protein [Nesterenkonia lutea]MBE1523577.1 hypothetical protein [Nesterenkonia lutea]